LTVHPMAQHARPAATIGKKVICPLKR